VEGDRLCVDTVAGASGGNNNSEVVAR